MTTRMWLGSWLFCLGLCWLTACQSKPQKAEVALPMTFSQATANSVEPLLSEPLHHVFERSCATCHGPNGHGITAVAPDLRRAKRRSVEQFIQFFSDPQQGHPGAQLPPPVWINADEIKLMANYLALQTGGKVPIQERADE
jgi:mono/diheme cytochrome c family protein